MSGQGDRTAREIGLNVPKMGTAPASAVGDGITALLMVRRHLERRHHLTPVRVDA